MTFTTLSFALFFVAIFIPAIFLKSRVRIYKVYLLLVSAAFYFLIKPEFLAILAISILVNYFFNYLLSKHLNGNKTIFVFAIIANLIFLGVFKYYNFFIDAFLNITKSLNIPSTLGVIQILAPAGISFFTFKSISHLFDVNRGELKKFSLIDFANFVSFFPQIASGPLVRAAVFYEDLNSSRKYKYNLGEVTGLFIGGLFKKYVISSFLFIVLDGPFTSPANYNSLELFIAMLGYACLIFVDFSGYSDMANSVSMLLGFKPVINFNLPYSSESLKEFWRKWHISLSEWLKDYLYIPLGGNRKGEIRKYINLFLTMLIGGFWHGAGINFIIWGGIHGIGLAWSHFITWLFDFKENKLIKYTGVITTFIFVAIAWIFFNTKSVDIALQFIGQMFSFTDMNATGKIVSQSNLIDPVVILVIVGVLLWNFFGDKISKFGVWLLSRNIVITFILTAIAIGLILKFGPTTVPPFIYMSF
ncbi:MAG: MBOAT family O-acyltransferase [Candidatus Dojkabacteria bacterium]